jgi:regulator of RNase E activity RraA
MTAHAQTLDTAEFQRLRRLDTCTASNAIERLEVRLRNEGFIHGTAHCRFPELGPMLGYAATAVIRTSSQPMSGRCYYDRMDYWNYVASLPAPRVLVFQDADHEPGVGAFVGAIHASIASALQCVGCVTNGAVRDLEAVAHIGFHLFSGSTAVSHAYAHIVDFGSPVDLGGLRIHSGDLLHGDRHGVHSIPIDIAGRVAGIAAQIDAREREFFDFCRSSAFSLPALAKVIERMAVDGGAAGRETKQS